jgi:hypothetical protein
VPNNILDMMTEIFGEGITYTSEPADDAQDFDTTDDASADEGYLDATSGDSEFLEEPVDDADFDEE